jgi:PAS domain S-box-containing protein/putative nucleotidyltransferase with HDIG domain
MPEKSASKTHKQLAAEIKDLRARLSESEEILRAIRNGEVDALIVSGVGGEQVLTFQQVEEALRSSEEKYRTLVEEVNDGFYVSDEAGIFTFANPALAGIYGVETPQALVGRQFLDFVVPEMLQELGESHRRMLQAGHSPAVINHQIMRPDGTRAYIEVKSASIMKGDQIVGSRGVVRDVTERRLAEEALRASEEKFRNYIEYAPGGIFIVDETGRYIDANPSACRILGYSKEDILNMSIRDLLAEESLEDGLSHFRNITELNSARSDLWHKHKDGSKRCLTISAVKLSTNRFLGFCVDITERKQAEEELRQSEARFRILFEQAADVILQLEITPDGIPVIREANNATLRVLGYTRNELIGRPVSFIEDLTDTAKVIDDRRRNILSGTGTVFDTRHRCKDGATRDFECSVTEMKVGSKTFAISVERDVTERSRAVDRIRRQLEHLTAMSAIDRVIAANFNLMVSLSEILSHVIAELGMDAADILILNSNSKMLEFCVEHGFRFPAVRKTRIRMGDTLAGRAALERRLVQVADLGVEPENPSAQTYWKGEDFVCYYGVPLISKGQVKGVLEVFHRAALEPDQEWFDFLNALAGQTAIAIENSTLFESLQRSNMDLAMAYDATIEGWSHALDLRDKETEGHTQRVTETTVKLARAFGMSEADLVQVRWGALLHDIGKMGVPDGILHKPGPLSEEEWGAMKKHPTFAYEMLAPIGYLRLALDIPYCHHEKWDGSGYPRGLKGAQIPLIARIFAVVDVWDALRSDRPYRAAWTEEKALEYIQDSSGGYFDPHVVDVVMQNLGLFEASRVPA